MSSKIYFNDDKGVKFKVQRKLVNWTTRSYHVLAPKHAVRSAQNLLMTPLRMKTQGEVPKDMIKGKLTTSQGVLTTYTLGEGPLWLLVHGWSGNASQFFALMEHIASKGFKVMAYDHPAHGESDGIHGHLPGFVKSLEEVSDACGEIYGVVAHSMGAAVVLESRNTNLEGKPCLLIAPVLNYLENLFGSIKHSGFSMRLFKTIVAEIENEYNYKIDKINSFERLSTRVKPTVIVHDEKDRFAKFSIAKQFSDDLEKVTLLPTQNLGHGRIIASDQALNAFDELFKQIEQ